MTKGNVGPWNRKSHSGEKPVESEGLWRAVHSSIQCACTKMGSLGIIFSCQSRGYLKIGILCNNKYGMCGAFPVSEFYHIPRCSLTFTALYNTQCEGSSLLCRDGQTVYPLTTQHSSILYFITVSKNISAWKNCQHVLTQGAEALSVSGH